MALSKVKKVLLVEDEVIIAIATKNALERFHYDVITAYNPKIALETITDEDSIDLILMDLDLNDEMDGISLSKEILKMKDIPIVFLSSHSSLTFIEKTEQITSYGFIVKNSTVTVIDTSIKMALQLFESKKNLVKELENHRITAEALIRNEEKLATTLNSIGDAVIVTDIHGNITRMNPTSERLTGFSSSEAIGKPLEKIFVIFNVYTKEVVPNPVEVVLKSGQVVGLANHTTLRSKNGKEYQIFDSASPIKEENGKMQGVVLVFSDITEKYEKEEAIRFNENLLSESQRIAKIGSWSFEFESQKLFWSKETYNIYGVDPATFHLTVENYLKFIHPEDLDYVIEKGKSIETGETDGSFTEFRIIKNSGEIRYLRGFADRLPPSVYSQARMVGTVQDITDQKIETDRYRILFENTSDAIFVTDSNFKILDLNESFSNLTGYQKQELIGESVLILIFEDDFYKINYEKFQQAQILGKFESKWKFRTKEGEVINVEIVSYKVTEESRIAIIKKNK